MRDCYMAVDKVTGEYFGGKRNGTHIGCPKINFLKSAMTNAKVKKDKYFFIRLSFNENLTPELTQIYE